ncbi:hypothetical protein EV363DRAFT_1346527 [Boletus edulis]|uniref:Uncharacterized protein n=1 Tax=Boletus edulis BED1 TaxID=1328754 RepID=A0AAD4GCU1_BOLED|nr:hypothetical protein EV363DRAFT_1346527 [Boletus edulis]KAF8436783.1 hypothetical protein L210DRAFT_3547525 [Boletus edulis BED1]
MDEGEVVCSICLGFIFFPWCLQGARRSAPFYFLGFSIVSVSPESFSFVGACLTPFLGYSIVSSSI